MMKYEVYLTKSTDIDSIGFQSRLKSLEIRDCFILLEPTNKNRLAILTRPPMDTTVVESILKGKGGVLYIDRCRISSAKWDQEAMERCNSPRSTSILTGGGRINTFKIKTPYIVDTTKGRFPTNLILKHSPKCYCEGTKMVKPSNGSGIAYHDNLDSAGEGSSWKIEKKEVTGNKGYVLENGTEEVPNWICSKECPVLAMDAQSGVLHARGNTTPTKSNESSWFVTYPNDTNPSDSGGAARFFKQVQTKEELDDYLK